MSREFLDERRRALEESFFRKRNAELLDKLKNQLQLESKRKELAMVSGIKDEKLLDRLLSLELSPQTVAALALVPMIRVAWADGRLEPKEREAILESAVQAGLDKASLSYHWLISWLESKPDDELVSAWKGYVHALQATLDDRDRQALHNGLIKRARHVAKSAGGALGLANPISEKEEAVLQDIETTFSGS